MVAPFSFISKLISDKGFKKTKDRRNGKAGLSANYDTALPNQQS